MSVSKAQSKESTYNDWSLLYADTLSNNFSAELEEIGVAFSKKKNKKKKKKKKI
jgi:hypothetical protein